MSDKRMTDEAFETAEGERVWREARSAESITEKKIAEALALAGVATLSFHCHVCNHQWDEVRAADEEGYLELYGFCSICRSNGKSEPWLAEETRLPISVSEAIKSLASALDEARAQLAARDAEIARLKQMVTQAAYDTYLGICRGCANNPCVPGCEFYVGDCADAAPIPSRQREIDLALGRPDFDAATA